MLAPVNHILPLATIERERLLPVEGKVLVTLNQSVSSTDVIAETTWSREHVLFDVARIFNIPNDAADQLIHVKMNDDVTEGTEIATAKGIFSRTIRAPRAGRVVAAGGGQVLLEVGNAAVKLNAGIPGTIVQIIPKQGAIIRTVGALVQGTWGNARINAGLMVNLTEKPDDVLTTSRLDISLRGSIILAGHVQDVDMLRAAADLPVRGLILASISPTVLSVARQVHFPIVVIDGFGNIPMNTVAYKLLTSNAKREVTLNAEPFDRFSGVRPEVIIPLPVSQEPPIPIDVDTLEPGLTVRIRREPHFGAIGKLMQIHRGLTVLPSGLRAETASVKIENGEQILVPLVNMEIVG